MKNSEKFSYTELHLCFTFALVSNDSCKADRDARVPKYEKSANSQK